MARVSDFDPGVLALFDGYVHGRLTRRDFLDRAAKLVASGTTAAAVLASLSPDYALARQVDPDDPAITVGYKQYASPAGAGVMQAYLARPADTGHKLPGVVVIHENRGLNPYIEDVARRLAIAGYLGHGQGRCGRLLLRRRHGPQARRRNSGACGGCCILWAASDGPGCRAYRSAVDAASRGTRRTHQRWLARL